MKNKRGSVFAWFLIICALAFGVFAYIQTKKPVTPDTNVMGWYGSDDNGKKVDLSNKNIDGTGHSDTLKFTSRLKDFAGRFGEVKSGSEDAVDINNQSNFINLEAERWVLQGSMGFTVKGGSSDIRLSGTVEGHGKETDVDIGNWSDQSHQKTKNVILNLSREDGAPVRVRVLWGDMPVLTPGSGPYTFLFPWPGMPGHDLIVRSFYWLRSVGFFK